MAGDVCGCMHAATTLAQPRANAIKRNLCARMRPRNGGRVAHKSQVGVVGGGQAGGGDGEEGGVAMQVDDRVGGCEGGGEGHAYLNTCQRECHDGVQTRR
jgi:hypothetical protein